MENYGISRLYFSLCRLRPLRYYTLCGRIRDDSSEEKNTNHPFGFVCRRLRCFTVWFSNERVSDGSGRRGPDVDIADENDRIRERNGTDRANVKGSGLCGNHRTRRPDVTVEFSKLNPPVITLSVPQHAFAKVVVSLSLNPHSRILGFPKYSFPRSRARPSHHPLPPAAIIAVGTEYIVYRRCIPR